MKTVQMTLDDELVERVDEIVERLGTTRSAFTRKALRRALEFLGEVTVAPITSTIRDIPSEVHLARDDGTDRECAVNLDHVQTVSRGKLGALITTLTRERMLQVRDAIRFALDA